MSPANDPSLHGLCDCDCCNGASASTPADVANRPGLPAIVYRVGTHGTFKESMLASLSDARRRALASFNTRDDDDLSIALLDSWAVVADVLSFYQERIANESYLRTATERRSVLELTRAIGYELAPGVAAGTWLAFTVENPTAGLPQIAGAPAVVAIPRGTRAQSIPGQGEKPQSFETSETIEARPEWNALKPRASRLRLPKIDDTVLYLKGTATGLREGDVLLVVGDERLADPGSERWECRLVRSVTPVPSNDPASGYTAVVLDHGLGSHAPYMPPPALNPRIYALRQRAGLFGANAPDWNTMPATLRTELGGAANSAGVTLREWPGLTIAGVSGLPATGTGLQGDYFNAPDFTEPKFARVDAKIDFDWSTGSPGGGVDADTFSVRWTGALRPADSGMHTFHLTADDGARLWVGEQLLIDSWQAGNTTTRDGSLALDAGKLYRVKLEYFEKVGAALVRLEWTNAKGKREMIPSAALYPRYPGDIYLDALYPKIFAGGWVVLSAPEERELYRVDSVSETSRTGFALAARSTRLALSGEYLLEKFNDKVRETAVYAVSEELELAGTPITDPVAGGSIELEGAVDGLRKGQLLAVTGIDIGSGLLLSEVAQIDDVAVADGVVKVMLKDDLLRQFRRDSVTINANVAPGTHGESKAEILGSGDASRAFQRFTLREKPLTYVSADNPRGGISTLEVRVNGVLWEEVPTLYGRSPREHVYITRADDDGTTAVIFGDGRTGSRLPTGSENITAAYRVGIGEEGEVNAGQIALLMTRPLGVKGVLNPVAATGAANPQSADDSREHAPRTVLTLGRIVSLRDFEDFARTFSGVGKALATSTWNHDGRGVLLTVAGDDGDPVPDGSRTQKNLLAAIVAAGDPHVPVQVKSYRSVTFTIRGRAVADPRYLPGTVAAAIERALRSRFSFAARSFGQPVDIGEVIATVQGVPGVLFADIDEIRRKGAPDAAATLPSDYPKSGAIASAALPAELLTLDPDPLDGLEVTQWVST